MLAYLRSDGFRDSLPAYLVWEMPGYYDINDDGMLREALADAAGSCAASPVAAVERPAEAGSAPLFGPLPPDLAAADHYVELELSDRRVRHLTLAFSYAGRPDAVPIDRSGRAPADGRFALAADEAATAPIDGVTLALPDGVARTVTARLCRFPA